MCRPAEEMQTERARLCLQVLLSVVTRLYLSFVSIFSFWMHVVIIIPTFYRLTVAICYSVSSQAFFFFFLINHKRLILMVILMENKKPAVSETSSAKQQQYTKG